MGKERKKNKKTLFKEKKRDLKPHTIKKKSPRELEIQKSVQC